MISSPIPRQKMDRHCGSKAQMQPRRNEQTEYGTHRAHDAIQGVEPHAPMKGQPAKQDQLALKTKERQHVTENARDEDYVQQWLKQSSNQTVPLDSNSRRQEGSSRSQEGERRHPKPSDFKAFHNNGIDEQSYAPLDRQRRRRNSSGSSLLELGVQPNNHQTKEEKPRQLLKDPSRKRQKLSQLTSASDTSDKPRSPNKAFEKRLRNKTLETRYEPKIKVGRPKKPENSRPKGKKRGDRSKAGRKAGEALMQNFSSKSIAHERLTMQPSHSHGLFHKGKASSLYGRRGIPDLAFSEMEFLRHSSKHALEIEGENLSYKSRQKEKRTAQRAQDEITSFFKTSKPQHRKSERQAEISQPEYSYERHIRSSERERSSRYQHSVSGSPGQSSNMLGLQYLGFGRSGPSPERPLVPYRPEIFMSQKGSDRIESPSTQGAQNTSEVSWSESASAASKAAQRKIGRTDMRSERSVTPETIRRSLDKTGIFRDTGIQRKSILEHHSFSTPSQSMPHDAMENQESNLGQAAAGRFSSDTEALNLGDQRRSNIRIEPNARAYAAQLIASFRHNVGTGAQEVSERTQERPQNGAVITKVPLVEYYNPKNGWSEDPRNVTDVQTADRSDPSAFRPLSRQERAKNAYIVRSPSTTTPKNYVADLVAIETSQAAEEPPTEKLLGKELDVPADAITQNKSVRGAQDNTLERDTIQDDPKLGLTYSPHKKISVEYSMPAYTEDNLESTVTQQQTGTEHSQGVQAKVQNPSVEYGETQQKSSLTIRGFSSKQIIYPNSQHRVLTPPESVVPMYQQQIHVEHSPDDAQVHRDVVQQGHLFGSDLLYARNVSEEQEVHDDIHVEWTDESENLELDADEYETLENDLNYNHYEGYGQHYECGEVQQLANNYSSNYPPDHEERIASNLQPEQLHRNSDYSSNAQEALHDDAQGGDLGSDEQRMNGFWKPFRRY